MEASVLTPTAWSSGAATAETALTLPWTAELGGIAISFGAGTLDRLGEVAREFGAQRVLVVSDPGIRAAGHLERAVGILTAAGHQVAVFAEVSVNPTTDDVAAGVAQARAHMSELIVALGGGSAMDCAKGINFLVTNGGRMEDYWGMGKAVRPLLPAIGVPTTAGTGSEAQSYALIAQADTHRKMACGDKKARFRHVLLDPELLASLPAPTAAITAIDAISHAVESQVTRQRNPISGLLARAAWQHLATNFNDFLAARSNRSAAGAMLLGAHLAGAAIEVSMLGAAHASANPLTAHAGITHGLAVGVMLPHVVRYNRAVAEPLYRELAVAIGQEPADASAWMAQQVHAFLEVAGLPTTLGALGIRREQIPLLAQEATTQWTGQFNPRPLTVADFQELYAQAL